MFNYRRTARRKALGISDADSKALDQAFGYSPVDRAKLSGGSKSPYYGISVAEFAQRFKHDVDNAIDELEKAERKTTIPCLAPDEMRCSVCGRIAPVDEIMWDTYNSATGWMVCIDCDDLDESER
jgi:hypothetical protein